MSERKRTRARIDTGDLFRFGVRDGRVGFGRVISTDARVGAFHGGLLVYIYDDFAEPGGGVPDLSPLRLLLPPLILTGELWRNGSFERIGNRPIAAADRLPVHCFRDHQGHYWNEHGDPLPAPVEPVGAAAVTTPGGFQRALASRLDERGTA